MKRLNQLFGSSKKESDLENLGVDGPHSVRSVANNRARKRITNLSCFTGGATGRCRQCNLSRRACNCQRCHLCDSFLWTLQSRHHCRMCWRACCPTCSSQNRINDFLVNEPTRTCDSCATPIALLSVAGVAGAYSLRVSDCQSNGEGEVIDHPVGPFQWGMYVLTCALTSPRRCVNPSCSVPFIYKARCQRCQVPTVPMKPHEVRGLETLTPTVNVKPLDSAAVKMLDITELLVSDERNAALAEMTAGDVDRVFSEFMPDHPECTAFYGLRESAWDSRKVILSCIAAGVASDGRQTPNISLGLSDHPTSRLLRVVRVEASYSVFETPGKVRYFAFPTVQDLADLREQLQPQTRRREVWSSTAANCIGRVVVDAAAASAAGLSVKVGEFEAQMGILDSLEASTVMHDVCKDVVRAAREGYEVVLCGHSLGGAMAALISSILLLENTEDLQGRLLCITFGAPLVANRGLSDLLDMQKLRSCFQHFVHYSDIIPRLHYLQPLMESGSMSLPLDSMYNSDAAARILDLVIGWCSNGLSPKKRSAMLVAPQKASKEESSSDDDLVIETEKVNEALAETIAGDVFAHSREPFANNLSPKEWTDGCDSFSSSFTHFSTKEFREAQQLDAYGCYNFLWKGSYAYAFSNSPSRTIGLLCDRAMIRMELRYHLLSSYTAALMTYVQSIPEGAE